MAIFQVIAAVLKDPNDSTTLSLIFGNKTEDDILVRHVQFRAVGMVWAHELPRTNSIPTVGTIVRPQSFHVADSHAVLQVRDMLDGYQKAHPDRFKLWYDSPIGTPISPQLALESNRPIPTIPR